MNRRHAFVATTAGLCAVLGIYACGDGTTEPPPPEPDPPRATAVTVTPATAELTAVGATVRLSANVRDQNGQAMAGAAVEWSSSDVAVATVDAGGLVTAAGNGQVTVTATSGAASGTTRVMVAQSPDSVAVAPAEAIIAALGDTLRLAAGAFDANGHPVADAEFAWASSDVAVATVGAGGLVAATGNGTATITATAGSASASAAVTVAQEVSAVEVSPTTDTLAAFGDTLRLAAGAFDANGHPVADAEFAWASSDVAVATVDAGGLVTAAGNGAATITATAGSASASAAVTVAQEVSAVEVSPTTDTLAAFGDTLRLAAGAFDANGHPVADAEFAWASSDVAVATVDAGGLVTAAGNGQATVTATVGEASSSVQITVEQVVSGAEVAPPTATFVSLGDTMRLAAEAFDGNGHAVADAEFAWASSDVAVATVDAGGLVTAAGNGQATVTATVGEASSSVQITVEQVVSGAEVAPPTATFVSLGDTMRLAAEAFDGNGHAVADAEFSWASSDVAVATVDTNGLVTAAGNGAATITATAGSASGSATVTVAQSPDSVAVAPAEAVIAALGDTLRLAAGAFDANGHAVADAEFSWASSDVAVATVDAGGLVTAASNGAATVTATSGQASSDARVTVEQQVAGVELSPSTAALLPGDTLRIMASAVDANGHAVAGAAFTWTTSDTTIATVDTTGLVTARGPGAVTVSAVVNEIEARADVLVEAATLVAFADDSVRVAEGETRVVGVEYRVRNLAAPLAIQVSVLEDGAEAADYEVSDLGFEIPAGSGLEGTIEFTVRAVTDDLFAEGEEGLSLRLAAPEEGGAEVGAALPVRIADASVAACVGVTLTATPPAQPPEVTGWTEEPVVWTDLALDVSTGAADAALEWLGPYERRPLAPHNLSHPYYMEIRERGLDIEPYPSHQVFLVTDWRMQPYSGGVRQRMRVEWQRGDELALRFRSPSGACAVEPIARCRDDGCELTRREE